MLRKWKTHKWEIYRIPERILKNHKGTDLNKIRPVLVLSNAKSLDYKALIMEMSTKQHKNSLLLYSWIDKKTGNTVNSYIAIDKIHTIDVHYLQDKYKVKSKSIPQEHRNTISKYLNQIINGN